jgi:hypothetical protein
MNIPVRSVLPVSLMWLTLAALVPAAYGAPVQLVDQAPVRITHVGNGVMLVDFGRVAFGNVRLAPPAGATNPIAVHFGEAFASGRINRKPPGTVRYASTNINLHGPDEVVASPPADKRNTNQPPPLLKPEELGVVVPAVLTPPEWGPILPFRWVEIEGWPGELRPEQITRRAAFAASWDDEAASFHSSDDMLNRIWELCRYSIKATTFAGVFVDGDRERIPYEADAYLNQLSYYTVSGDLQMPRDTYDWLMAHPTWPTEWAPHMVFMAHADWMHTGDRVWLALRYERLKTKLLLERTRSDGLVVSAPEQMARGDLVDWPRGERDDFAFMPVNTVVNAFHLRAISLMADLARALGKTADAEEFTARARATRTVFQGKLFDGARGIYRDGEGTEHASLHANLFPLAFDLVPAEHQTQVTHWLAERGMACSVYAAQYLLEGLFQHDAAGTALELISAPTDRSWRHMVESGTTITWEAWDQRYKPNQDWNHAWGAAPANLLPRFVLGAQPIAAGWERALIRPHADGLTFSEGKIPTPRGAIQVSWKRDSSFTLKLSLPSGVSARVELPATETAQGVLIDSKPVEATRIGGYWILRDDVVGTRVIEEK